MAATLGKRNPFRYRGYVYDEESGLYYLRSRYYNPEWGRFVNMDGMLAAGLLMANGFAYCSNDPVRRTDTDGANWFTDGLKKVGNFIKECFQAQAKANVISAQQTVHAANKIGNAAKKAARSVGNFVKKVLRAQVEADILTAEMNARAVSNLIDGAKKVANKVGNTLKKAFQAQQQADIISAQMTYHAACTLGENWKEVVRYSTYVYTGGSLAVSALTNAGKLTLPPQVTATMWVVDAALWIYGIGNDEGWW